MMNTLRKALCALTAIMVAAFALPASANFGPNEKFSVRITPASVSAGAQTITATIKNETATWWWIEPIKSLKITAPAGVTITGATWAAPIPNPSGSISVASNVVSVNNVYVKNGQSVVLTLMATFPSSTDCGAPANFTWASQAWEKSGFGGDKFNLVAALSSLTTMVSAPACSMVFVTQPLNALSGGVIGGPVKIQVSPASAFSGKSITLGFASSPGGSPAFAAGTNVAPIDASGFATFPNLSISGPVGAYTLSATTGATGYPTATSAPFNIAASDGVLDCQGQPNGQNDQFSDLTGPTKVSGSRGSNKDNSACKLVVYDLAILNPHKVAFVWDTTNQPNAAFAYSIDWAPEFVDTVTGLPKVTQLAWTLTGGNPNFVPGRACLSPNLPSPYGTLNATIGSGDTTISVNAVVPLPAAPFPIVIGTERMTVTAVGASWTVVRGVGGTAAATHLAGVSVMSTPFPLDNSVPVPLQVPMCIQDEMFVTLPPDRCTPIDGNTSCVGVSSTIFDAGDGFVSRDF